MFIFFLLFFNFQPSYSGASQKFHQGDLTTESFKSPHRLTANSIYDVWPKINSAWNQPRNEATSNPHNGTDLGMTAKTPVHSVFDGEVAQKGADWILIKRTNQNFYMVYKHVIPENLAIGAIVSTTTVIATIQSITRTHLHFGLTTNSNSDYTKLIWAANNRPYQHVTADKWYNGRGLDFMKRHYYSSGAITLYANASDDQNANETPQKVLIYHRINGTTTWKGPVTMSAGTDYKYSSNFGSLGYFNNDRVDWLVVGYRAGTFATGRPNWAFYPGFYETQAEKPDSNSKFFTTTVSGLPNPI